MTLDLPTPPLPDATATIDVDGGERDLRLLRRRRAAASQLLDERLALFRRHGGEVDRHALHALERLHRRRHVVRDAVLQRTALDRDQDVDADGVAFDRDAAQHADVLDRPADLGIHDAAECLADLGFGDHRVLSGSKLG